MLLLILKSSVCLSVFMLFYKLCLEKITIHNFKRFYLLGVILISIGIPFITFTEYIEEEPQIFETITFQQDYITPGNFKIIEPAKSFQDYIPYVLWSLYGIGVLLFAFRFFRNLFQLVQKIRLNPKCKYLGFTNVLLKNDVTPHTFFNYIFLNKALFENNKIPAEVLLHEQTHAKQKHALDILFIEILQILFWFNPLLYFIKKDIKLNHEFLADQAVINHGIITKDYQQLLLAFSSNASYTSLANAINYSLIKKRFTVMKTQTSKTLIWFRSLIILPLLAILIFSFSEKVKIEKEIRNINSFIKPNSLINEIRVFIDENRKVLVYENQIDFKQLSNELLKIKNHLIKKHTVAPKLFIQVEDHVTDEYLKEIKKEIEKSKLKISNFKSKSLVLSEKISDSYFKETTFTADYMHFGSKKEGLVQGYTMPKNTTIIESENLKNSLKYLIEKKVSLQKDLSKAKKEKNKIAIKKQIEFLTLRIATIDNTLNSYNKEALQKSVALIITIIDTKTISINGEEYDLKNIDNYIGSFVKELSSQQKENLIPVIVYGSLDDDKTIETVKNILRNHNILKVNKKINVPYKDNTVHKNLQKGAVKGVIINYNELTKELKDSKTSSAKNSLKIKDIKIVIDVTKSIFLNNKKILFKDLKEEVNNINPSLSIKQKQKYLSGQIIIASSNFAEYAKQIKDVLTRDCYIVNW